MSILKANNLEFLNPIKLKVNFSRTGGKIVKTPLHALSSYLAMFTPALPEYFIEKFTKEGDTIMDPFSGRGTTALRAREMNRNFVGGDLNPYAIALTKAKIGLVSLEKSINFVNKLKKEYDQLKWEKEVNKSKYKELKYFYKRTVLKQLIYIREKIGKSYLSNNDTVSFILGVVLGLMHGPQRKNGDTIYFSINMPNTISMAPNYVKNYVQKNKLKKPMMNDLYLMIIQLILV